MAKGGRSCAQEVGFDHCRVYAHLFRGDLYRPLVYLLDRFRSEGDSRHEDQQPPSPRERRADRGCGSGMTLSQRVVHNGDDVFLGKHLVGVVHPAFANVADFLGDQSVPETQLRSTHLDHAARSAASIRLASSTKHRNIDKQIRVRIGAMLHSTGVGKFGSLVGNRVKIGQTRYSRRIRRSSLTRSFLGYHWWTRKANEPLSKGNDDDTAPI